MANIRGIYLYIKRRTRFVWICVAIVIIILVDVLVDRNKTYRQIRKFISYYICIINIFEDKSPLYAKYVSTNKEVCGIPYETTIHQSSNSPVGKYHKKRK